MSAAQDTPSPPVEPLNGERVLLRIYLRTADRAPRAPTFERIVKAARSERLAGATVLKGIMGYGAHGTSRPAPLAVVEHLPIIVEIVDSAQRLGAFLQGPLENILEHGIATLERAAVIVHRPRINAATQPPLKLPGPHRPLSTIPSLETQGARMNLEEDAVLVRVFLGESDRSDDGRPLYEAIVREARALGLAGATVLRGVEGFGANSVVHKAALLEMSTDLPMVIEMVDRDAKVEQILPHLEQVVKEGMITLERVAIVRYHHNPADAPAG